MNQAYICLYPLRFGLQVTTEHQIEFPVLSSMFSLVICFIQSKYIPTVSWDICQSQEVYILYFYFKNGELKLKKKSTAT